MSARCSLFASGRRWSLLVVVLAMVGVLAPPAGADDDAAGPGDADDVGQAGYEAQLRRTSFGVPHVVADDLPSAAFGVGYAYAQDNACVLLEQAVTVRSQRSMVFGASDANRASDLFHARIRELGRVEALLTGELGPAPSDEARAVVRGYLDGFNHYLEVAADPQRDDEQLTDPACAGEDWVQPLTERELWHYYHALMMRAGEGALIDGIVAAAPPSATSSAVARATRPAPDVRREAAAWLDERLGDPSAFGSNAYALGPEATTAGTGMLLGNPHFPWQGALRFSRMQLTVPGDLDVTGASLHGIPLVNIGHTEGVAWSHTVSTAQRFTLHVLQLESGSPTRYVVDGEVRELEPVEVSIEVPGADGQPETLTHTFYESHLGPVLHLGPITWAQSTALVVNDVNARNARAMDVWMGMNRADSIDELRDALDEHQGIPWVNTIAVDADGQAMYADHSVVPAIDADTIAECSIFAVQGRELFDASRSECEPANDPSAAAPGILAPADLPVLVRDDYVANMNNSHWLANPEQPLEGFSPLIGSERRDIGLRARLGLLKIEERLAGTDGLGEPGFTLEQLQQVMFSNRNLAAELVVDELVAACREAGEVEVDDATVELDEACDVLEDWDRTVGVDARGAHVFRAFVAEGGLGFVEEFDLEDPLRTPAGLDLADGAALEALGRAVQLFTQAGVALDARLGDVQSATRNGVRTEVHGGPSAEGVFNQLNAAPFDPELGEYPDVLSGPSFVMTVEFTDDGPVSEAILTYSQSTDPTSPHFADQLPRYRDQDWIPMRFAEDDILADPELTVTELEAPIPPAEPIEPAPPEQPDTPAPEFPDVPSDSVHADAIGRLVAAGIITGRADGTFGPAEPVQRGQLALMLVRALQPPVSDQAPFPDVTGDDERDRAINAAAAAGWVRGLDDGRFAPGDPITRAQLASMIARAFEVEVDEEPAEVRFDDVEGVHAGAIEALAELGVVTGFTDGSFGPALPVRRDQTASMLDRALDALG